MCPPALEVPGNFFRTSEVPQAMLLQSVTSELECRCVPYYLTCEEMSGECAHCEHGGSAAELHEDRADRS